MPPVNPQQNAREAFREHINVPIAIPAWGLLCMIAGAIFTSGTLYQKMDALIENNHKNDAQVLAIRERQIVNTATLQALQDQARAFEARLSALERGKP